MTNKTKVHKPTPRVPPVSEKTTYLLRDIDADYWRKVKARAALEGVSLKTLFESLLDDWMSKTPTSGARA